MLSLICFGFCAEGCYVNEHFHMLPSIALRDFVTLQVQTFVVFTQALAELTKYRCALLFVKKYLKKKTYYNVFFFFMFRDYISVSHFLSNFSLTSYSGSLSKTPSGIFRTHVIFSGLLGGFW